MDGLNTVEINVSFNYGGLSLSFIKTFKMSFAPFYDLMLVENNEKFEHIVELSRNEYCKTIIMYIPSFLNKDCKFHVDVRNSWKRGVTDEVVYYTLECFKSHGWIRQDNTNIEELIALMNKQYKR